MTKVNVHYKFNKDALIDTIYNLAFEGNEIDQKNDFKGDNNYAGIVKNVNVTDKINIEIKLGGIKKTKFKLECTVIAIDQIGTDSKENPIYEEIGESMKIDKTPIEEEIQENTFYYSKKPYKIIL